MPDMEKVIKATELLDDFFNEYRAVYYISPHEAWEIIKDALKEQEAIEPVLEQGFMVCGDCGHEVIVQRLIGDEVFDEKVSYCPACGRSVKWE